MKLVEKYVSKIDDFGLPMVDNPEWKVLSTHVAKQRFELFDTEVKAKLVELVNALHKETIFFSEHEDELADLTDDDVAPHLLPKSKICVSLEEVLKIIENV